MLKRISALIICLAIPLVTFAQVPNSFKYQAVARNSSGEVLANQPVSFRISILEGSSFGGVMFSEVHPVTTNGFGLVNLDIGKGSILSGNIANIDWGSSNHFLKVELDPSGGSSFQFMGTTELLSVPYALHAKTVENDLVEDADADPGNEIQVLERYGNELSLSRDGGTVDISVQGDDWGDQAAYTNASLTGNGTEGSPLGLAQQAAASGQVLKWDGSAWAPGDDNSGSGFWQQNGSDIYYTAGRIGVGTTSPSLDLSIDKSGHAQQLIKGTMDAVLFLDKGSASRYSTIGFRDQGENKFWEGLLQNNNFRISTRFDALDGMEITSAGNTNFSGAVSVSGNQSISGNLSLSGSQTTGGNTTINGKLGIGKTPSAFALEIMGGSLSYTKYYHTGSGTGTTDGLLMGTESSNTAWIWNYENGHMRFGTNNSDRMILTSNGRVGIGTTGPSFKLDVAGQININKGIGEDQALYVNGSEALWWNGTYFSWGYGSKFNYFADPVGIKTNSLSTYELVVNGQAAKTGGGTWSNYSDIRLKNILGQYDKGLNDIIKLRPVTFRYKDGNSLGLDCENEQVGFIAQEVQEIFPEAVNEAAEGYLDFNMHSVNVALVNAVRELKQENDELKARLERLERAIVQLGKPKE